MGVFNTLRVKMGKFVVVVIALAIISFTLADILGPNSIILGDRNTVGEIAGNKISYDEYQKAVQEREAYYVANFNRNPTERELPALRQQAWELLLVKYGFEREYEAVGVAVSDDEWRDLIQGKNIDPTIMSNFSNPQTGEFDSYLLQDFINNVRSYPPQIQLQWDMMLRDIKPGRIRMKYENLMLASTYVTKAEGQQDYESQNSIAEVRYLYVPFASVADSLVKVTDSELQDYLNKNKGKYKTQAARSIEYVVFPIVPSAQDTLELRTELAQLREEFQNTKEDSLFAEINTEGRQYFDKFTAATLPSVLQANAGNLSIGDVRGPYLEDNNFVLYKISNITQDTSYTARASHILIRWDDETPAAKEAAKTEAKRILDLVKGGAEFTQMAREYGTDGTANRGGDLGYFSSGDMVAPFEKAVFAAKTKGVLNDLVETEFGYHIINVTELKDNVKYHVAMVEREMVASETTLNDVMRNAEFFAGEAKDIASFKATAQSKGYIVNSATNIGPNDRNVAGIGETRELVAWLYREAKLGQVSEAFNLDEQYVVAVMTAEKSEGTAKLEDVRTELTMKLKDIKRGEIIQKRMNDLNGSLDEMAAAYGNQASVFSSSGLRLSSNSIPSVGFDPAAVGVAFSLEPGQKSSPMIVENGVIVMELEAITRAPIIADYSVYQNQVLQNVRNRASFGIAEAIREAAAIEDYRYKFY
jgi:peptidyl-prolyl cis-trans isomerase D